MTYRLIFHPKFAVELEDAIDWYKKISDKVSKNFKNETKVAIATIQKNPFAFQKIEQGFRLFYLKKFPYSIVFSVEENEILVYSFFHTSRNPNVWQTRGKP